MKRILMTTLVCLIFIAGVTASIGLGNYNRTRDMDKVYRDELLSQTEEVRINPTIDIKKVGDSCMWSAVQSGIISSYNNVFDCSGMSDAEIQDAVADEVLSRLENYADASIERKNTYEDYGTGNLEITEKK